MRGCFWRGLNSEVVTLSTRLDVQPISLHPWAKVMGKSKMTASYFCMQPSDWPERLYSSIQVKLYGYDENVLHHGDSYLHIFIVMYLLSLFDVFTWFNWIEGKKLQNNLIIYNDQVNKNWADRKLAPKVVLFTMAYRFWLLWCAWQQLNATNSLPSEARNKSVSFCISRQCRPIVLKLVIGWQWQHQGGQLYGYIHCIRNRCNLPRHRMTALSCITFIVHFPANCSLPLLGSIIPSHVAYM